MRNYCVLILLFAISCLSSELTEQEILNLVAKSINDYGTYSCTAPTITSCTSSTGSDAGCKSKCGFYSDSFNIGVENDRVTRLFILMCIHMKTL